eukprot:Skav232821  [mRNA]  locus=scaffold614:658642:668127:- [translate_table: standard]
MFRFFRRFVATCRFRDLSFPHGGFWPLEDANRGDVADDGGAASAAAAVFAAAPFERELKQLDVPDENLVELRSEEEEYGISSADFHAEFGERKRFAVLAFTSHRVARSMVNAPPPGALDGDVKLTKEQLRQIRVKSETRKPPAAPPMPTLETESSESESQGKPKAGAKTRGQRSDLERGDNSHLRRVKNWAAQPQWRQSPAFDIPVSDQFPDNQFPLGECVEYVGKNAFRTTSAEKRELERLASYDYEKIRKAGEVHRQVRRYVQSYVKPGMKMTEICQRLERKTHELVVANGLEAGWGFPTGCSLNWVAAHYTPNYGDETVLQFDDVCKLDFGVQVGGRIVDCAFTIAFNERYDPIIEATQAGTNTGVKEAGIDARFSEIGAAIQETIESYEIELNGKTFPIKPVRNLNGHSIGPYQIHGGKSVPITKNQEATIMEEGEFYAIATWSQRVALKIGVFSTHFYTFTVNF